MESCLIDIDYGDYPSCEFYTQETPRAKKNHTCGECGREISVGETYEKVTGKWDGLIITAKTCADCISVYNLFSGGIVFGELWHQLRDYIRFNTDDNNIAWSRIANLTPKARAKVCAIIEDDWSRFEEDD